MRIRKIVRNLIKEMYLTENEVKRINFEFKVPENVLKLSKIFKDNGFELFIVGGAVRDMILGKKPKDIDLVSDATPDQVEQILSGDYKTIPTGKAFGIITVVTPDGEEYEIAKYREDLGKGRRPEGGVKFSTIDADVMRRDLTINALYYDIEKKQIIDFVGGYEDILQKNIKTVGSATDRFDEDRLRILRAIRFASRFDSNLDQGIIDALRKDNSLKGISEERIRDEFIKGIQSSKFVRKFLILLDNYGLLKQIFEGLDYSQENFIDDNDPIVVIANILKTNPVDKVKSKLNQLRYTIDEISKITFLIYFDNFRPNQIFKFKKLQKLSKISDEQILDFARWNNIELGLVHKFLKFNLSVSGDELLNQGFKGKELGQEIERREIENFMNSF